MALLVISVTPFIMAAGTGGSLGGGIEVEEFEPMVFQCGERVLYDDDIQPWRITDQHPSPLDERNNHYLFEGERYQVDVLVFDKNKIEEAMVDLVLEGEEVCELVCPGAGEDCYEDCVTYDDFEINCVEESVTRTVYPDTNNNNIDHCNVRVGEETLHIFESDTMQGFKCTIDILDSEHMYGTFWMKVRAISGLTEEEGEYDEIARWFINPMVSLSVDGELDFSEVRPGTASYSTVLIENTAEGGVILDMFITGKDWPAADTELGRCQLVDDQGDEHDDILVNYLPLGAFRYYAENGAYSTRTDMEVDDDDYSDSINRNSDDEGYVNIHRQLNAGFEEAMFDEAEIIQENPLELSDPEENIYLANLLYPGSAGMSITFRLELPEPCYGNFESETDGSIFFWGEAV